MTLRYLGFARRRLQWVGCCAGRASRRSAAAIGLQGEPISVWCTWGMTEGTPERTDRSTSAAGTGTPAGSEPTRSRIPLWGWIAGAVVVIAGAVTVGILVNGDDTDPAVTATDTATSAPSGAASVPGTLDPNVVSTGTIDLSLDAVANFGVPTPAIWGAQTAEGWEASTAEQPGVSPIVNVELACVYTTSQNELTDVAVDPAGDRVASADSLQVLEQIFAERYPGAYATQESPSVGIPYGVPGSGQLVEFLTSQLSYNNATNGDPYTALFAVRAMPEIGGMMYTLLTCPTDVITSAEQSTLWSDLLAHSTVLAE